jgi:hypothetical protein
MSRGGGVPQREAGGGFPASVALAVVGGGFRLPPGVRTRPRLVAPRPGLPPRERLRLVLEGVELVELLVEMGADDSAERGALALLAELRQLQTDMGF